MASNSTTAMDYSVVEAQAIALEVGGGGMRAVGVLMEALANSLKLMAWFPGIAALIRYDEGISKAANNLADVMYHLSGALKQAITDHKNGDTDVKGYFTMTMG